MKRQLRSLLGVFFFLLMGCGEANLPDKPPNPTRSDPFLSSVAFNTVDPARAVAVLEPFGTMAVPPKGNEFKPMFALSFEFRNDIQIVGSNRAGEVAEIVRVPVGAGPRDVVAVDLNADGQLDLVTANTGDSTLTLIMRTTNGGFEPVTTISSNAAPHHLAAADIDGDGQPEVIASVGLDGQGGIFMWKVDVNTLVPVGNLFPSPGAARITAGDMDADGDMDLAVVHSGGLALLRNEDGALQLAKSFLPCDAPWGTAISDIDGSGKLDVAVACKGEVVVLFDPMLGIDKHLSLRPAGRLYDVIVADFDADGTLDIAGADVLDHVVRIWLSPLSGGNAIFFQHPVHRGPVALGTIDFGWDGDVDVAVVAYEQRTLEILKNATKE